MIILLVLFVVSMMACSTSTRTRRSIKKKCDCRKWSELNTPLDHKFIFYDEGIESA